MSKQQTKLLRELCQQLTEEDAQEVVAHWLAYTDRNATLVVEAASEIDQADAQKVVDGD